MEKDGTGKFVKGNSGRPKGSKNKNKILSNQRILDYFKDGGFEELISELKMLEGKDKVNAHLKLLEFVMPRQKSIDMTADVKNTEDKKTIEEYEKELQDLQKLKKEPSWTPNED